LDFGFWISDLGLGFEFEIRSESRLQATDATPTGMSVPTTASKSPERFRGWHFGGLKGSAFLLIGRLSRKSRIEGRFRLACATSKNCPTSE